VSASGSEGLFDSLLVQTVDPLLAFLLFEANVIVSGAPLLRITAMGSETVTFSFVAGPGQNRFGFVATNPDDFISSVLIQSLGGDAIADVRQVRIGSFTSSNSVQPLVATPEPGALILLGTGLFGLRVALRRRMPGRR
jgi:hypothetical protein